jgi:hypothetical protein
LEKLAFKQACHIRVKRGEDQSVDEEECGASG